MSDTCDVAVVGGGGSGLAAAIEARAAGREVILLEKNPALGGSTARSIGSLTASATPHQARAGIEDSPEEHFADMALFNGALDNRDNPELRRLMCEELPDTFRWLLDLGVRFSGPNPEPPHAKPRMHNVLPNARAYIHHLERHARRTGVDIRTGIRAEKLVVLEGAVGGVDCATPDGQRRFHARRGVILAAGDYTASVELKRQYISAQAAKVEAVNPTATGDGQKLALALGARILNGDQALGPELRFVAPQAETLVRRLPPWRALATAMAWSLDHAPARLLRPFMMRFITTALAPSPELFEQGAVLIDAQGERFCDERDEPALALSDRPGKSGYILIDGRLAARFSAWPHYISTAPGVAYAYLPDYRRNRKDVYASAATPGALAARLGMEPARLERTVAECDTLRTPPYIALGPVRGVFVHNEGGLAVDAEHRVLDARDRPIPGLYAAGSTGQGGLLLKGHGHHLAWAFTSGRRAGRLAAARDGG